MKVIGKRETNIQSIVGDVWWDKCINNGVLAFKDKYNLTRD